MVDGSIRMSRLFSSRLYSSGNLLHCMHEKPTILFSCLQLARSFSEHAYQLKEVFLIKKMAIEFQGVVWSLVLFAKYVPTGGLPIHINYCNSG